MKRADIAAAAAVAVLGALGVGGCTSAGPVTTVDPATAVGPSGTPGPVSACLSRPTKVDESAIIDWVDFVQLGGIQYLADPNATTRSVPAEQLGPVVGRVECRLSDLKYDGLPGPAADGDAAFLAIGTQVRSIRGYAPTCRVAARIDGANRVYLAQTGEAVSAQGPCATTSQRPTPG